jgi:hypothetical protein
MMEKIQTVGCALRTDLRHRAPAGARCAPYTTVYTVGAGTCAEETVIGKINAEAEIMQTTLRPRRLCASALNVLFLAHRAPHTA